jgi:hypothetical protein
MTIIASMIGIRTYVVYQDKANTTIVANVAATQMKELVLATTDYVQSNMSTIEAGSSPSSPYTIPLTWLQSPPVGTGSMLPSSFPTKDPYGQAWQIEVLQPMAGRLQVLVSTVGGNVLTDATASYIASLLGASGGFIPKNDSGLYLMSNEIYGTGGSWQISSMGYSGIAPGELGAMLFLY